MHRPLEYIEYICTKIINVLSIDPNNNILGLWMDDRIDKGSYFCIYLWMIVTVSGRLVNKIYS